MHYIFTQGQTLYSESLEGIPDVLPLCGHFISTVPTRHTQYRIQMIQSIIVSVVPFDTRKN